MPAVVPVYRKIARDFVLVRDSFYHIYCYSYVLGHIHSTVPPPSIRLLISENLEDAHDFLYKFNFNFM